MMLNKLWGKKKILCLNIYITTILWDICFVIRNQINWIYLSEICQFFKNREEMSLQFLYISNQIFQLLLLHYIVLLVRKWLSQYIISTQSCKELCKEKQDLLSYHIKFYIIKITMVYFQCNREFVWPFLFYE